MKKKMLKRKKSTLLKKDGKEYCVHPELKDDDLFQITATGIEHGFKTVYQKDFTLKDLKKASKYYSNYEDIEAISNDIISHLDKNQVELANRGDYIELYINISPEEEICLILNKIFVDASLLKEKNQELLEEIFELQASINLLKEDLEKKIQGLKDSNKIANRLKKERDELDKKLRELQKKMKELQEKCDRLEGELSENELDNLSELERLRKENERLRSQNNDGNDDRLRELEELLKKQKELNKKLLKNQKEGDKGLLNQLEELEQEYQERIKNLEEELKKLREQNKRLKSQLDGVDDYENKISELEEEIKLLKDENNKLKQRLKDSGDDLQNKLLELEEKLKKQIEINRQLKLKADKDKNDYENKLQDLQDKLKKLDDLNKKLQNKLKGIEEEYELKIEEYENTIRKLQDQNKKLQADQQKGEEEFEEKIKELEIELKKLKDENRQLKSDLKDGEDENENKLRDLENKNRKIEEEYKYKLMEMQEELNRQKDLNKKMKDKNNKNDDEMEDLKDELEKLRGELRQKTKMIDSLQSVRKDLEITVQSPPTKEKDKKKKIRKTSITKIITKTKRIRNLATAKTPIKDYKFMLTSDNKPIIKTYNSVTKVQNGYSGYTTNSKFLSEQKQRESLQNEMNDTEENSYIVRSRYSMNNKQLNPVYNNTEYQILSEREVIETSDVIERENELDLIKDRLGKNNLNLILLYKATRDGDDAEIFHAKVGDTRNNITLIKTSQGVRFGGYTSQSWDGINIFKEDDTAFVFSLTKLKTYDVNQKESAIWCYPNYGPVFEGYQIDIFDRFLTRDLSKTGKRGLGYDTNEDYELNNGEKNFVVDEMEVYGIQD
jgi:DNA repair exonuclease SbcCD ATPase subunit